MGLLALSVLLLDYGGLVCFLGAAVISFFTSSVARVVGALEHVSRKRLC